MSEPIHCRIVKLVELAAMCVTAAALGVAFFAPSAYNTKPDAFVTVCDTSTGFLVDVPTAYANISPLTTNLAAKPCNVPEQLPHTDSDQVVVCDTLTKQLVVVSGGLRNTFPYASLHSQEANFYCRIK